MPEGSDQTQNQTTQAPLNKPAATNGGATAQAPQWTSDLPPDLRSLPSLTRYKDLGTFARSFVGLEKQLGGRSPMPSAEWGDTEWENFNSKLRPESADKYSFSASELADKISESMKIDKGKLTLDEGFVKTMREAFHKNGVPDRTATALAEVYLGAQAAALQAEENKVNEGVESLKKDWGHAYEGNVELANRAINQLSSEIPGLDAAFEDPRIGSNPALVRLFSWLGQQMGEDTSVTGQQRVSEQDANEIRNKIQAMRNDPKHPLNDGDHPGHRAAVAEMQRLYEALNDGNEDRNPRRSA